MRKYWKCNLYDIFALREALEKLRRENLRLVKCRALHMVVEPTQKETGYTIFERNNENDENLARSNAFLGYAGCWMICRSDRPGVHVPLERDCQSFLQERWKTRERDIVEMVMWLLFVIVSIFVCRVPRYSAVPALILSALAILYVIAQLLCLSKAIKRILKGD